MPPSLLAQSGKQMVASGTVTQANMKISAVDGTAFVDFSLADVLTGKLGHELHIADSAGAEIIGIIKAAGTGETLVNVKADTMAANGTGAWSLDEGTLTFDTDHYLRVAEHGWAADLGGATITAGALYRSTITQKDGTASNVPVALGWYAGVSWRWSSATNTNAGWAANTKYQTAIESSAVAGVGFGAVTGAVNNAQFKLYSIDKITTPSATGVTITTQKGGTVYNFTAKSALFNYNDSSGYKYTIFKLWNAPIVASGAVTAANSHLDTITANAFAWLNGVDLSAYQDDRHMLWVYDSSGRGRGGFISSSAPAGETLNAEKITGWTNHPSDTWQTFTSSGKDVSSAIGTAGDHYGYSNELGSPSGQLIKVVLDLTVNSGHLRFFSSSGYAGNPPIIGTSDTGYLTTTQTKTLYYTEVPGGRYCNILATAAVNPSNVVLTPTAKRVLDPPSTAVKILSAKAGARGWLYADAAFDPNTAATYAVLFVGD